MTERTDASPGWQGLPVLDMPAPAVLMLGPLELRGADTRPVTVRRRKQRALLALLVIRAGQPVSTDEIIDALWGQRPPASARANVQSYVSEIRRLLAGAGVTEQLQLSRAGSGYRLESHGGVTDVGLFDRLLSQGETEMASGRPVAAVRHLTRALALWRGNVLEDLRQYDWTTSFAARLEQARLTAVEECAGARLALGENAEVAAELSGVVADHPLRERLWQRYIVALAQAGRRTDALQAYEQLRSCLADELSVQPGPALRDLARSLRSTGVPRSSVRPAQVPAAVPDFIGRGAVAGRLVEQVSGSSARARPMAAVVGVTGMAGIGKTALALYVAHRVARFFPDGQLFVNAQGAGEKPLDAADILGRFLRALGVDSRAVPHHREERAAMYRSLLAGRRVLVVLDAAVSNSCSVRLLMHQSLPQTLT